MGGMPSPFDGLQSSCRRSLDADASAPPPTFIDASRRGGGGGGGGFLEAGCCTMIPAPMPLRGCPSSALLAADALQALGGTGGGRVGGGGGGGDVLLAGARPLVLLAGISLKGGKLLVRFLLLRGSLSSPAFHCPSDRLLLPLP
jgi:hypothetical protein